MKRPRIIIADDHAIILEGLKSLLAPDFDIVGTAEDGRELLAIAGELAPDVILLDISMPLLNGIEAGERLRKLLPAAKLIYLTMHSDVSFVERALQLGASGYLLKSSAAVELSQAIYSAMNGDVYITPKVRKDVLAALGGGPPKSARGTGDLTARQREVLQLVAEGRSAKEIAHILGLSLKTVEFHKQRIMEELNLRNIADLTRYAVKHGIVQA